MSFTVSLLKMIRCNIGGEGGGRGFAFLSMGSAL